MSNEECSKTAVMRPRQQVFQRLWVCHLCHCEAGVGGHECKVNGRGVEPERAYSREDAHLTAKNIVLMMLKNTLRNIAYEIILNTVEKLKEFKSE